MKRLLGAILLLVVGLPLFGQGGTPPPKFVYVDVYVEAGERSLAVYQVHVHYGDGTRTGLTKPGTATVVGVEGGEGVFAPAPYFDPKAMQHVEVIIGALSTADEADLPSGRVRVARIHVMLAAGVEPVFGVVLLAAGTPDSQRFDTTATVEIGG